MNRDSSTDTSSSRATQAAGSRSVTAQLTGAGFLGRKWGSEGGVCVHLQSFRCCTAKTTQLQNEDKP